MQEVRQRREKVSKKLLFDTWENLHPGRPFLEVVGQDAEIRITSQATPETHMQFDK